MHVLYVLWPRNKWRHDGGGRVQEERRRYPHFPRRFSFWGMHSGNEGNCDLWPQSVMIENRFQLAQDYSWYIAKPGHAISHPPCFSTVVDGWFSMLSALRIRGLGRGWSRHQDIARGKVSERMDEPGMLKHQFWMRFENIIINYMTDRLWHGIVSSSDSAGRIATDANFIAISHCRHSPPDAIAVRVPKLPYAKHGWKVLWWLMWRKSDCLYWDNWAIVK